jgi:hypothetical protein
MGRRCYDKVQCASSACVASSPCSSGGTTSSTNARPTTRIISSLMQWLASVSLSLGVIIGIPLSFYCIDPASSSNLAQSLKLVTIGWTSLLHVSAWLLMVISAFVAFFMAQEAHHTYCSNSYCTVNASNQKRPKWLPRKIFFFDYDKKSVSVAQSAIALSIMFSLTCLIQSNLQMIFPSWAWNPFLWGGYHVYKPGTVAKALDGLCLDLALAKKSSIYSDMETPKEDPASIIKRKSTDIISKSVDDNHLKTRFRSKADPMSSQPRPEQLCLSEAKWKELSTDGLSSKIPGDIDTVLRGFQYMKYKSGGIILNVMSRDTVDAIPLLRQNVEGLLPFLSNLSVVVFENDSKDGSREAFYQWSSDVSGKYNVDVMECEDAPGCKFNLDHRDFDRNKPYETSSAIGRMAEFRQRMVDYILTEPRYENYTHMIVMDLDLGVSLSPLGVVHTLGLLPDNPVASAGRQVWPGSFGTIVPPYDFSAFRVTKTVKNKRLMKLHERFCDLKPKGDRWRNMCDAVSPMHTMLILGLDMLRKEPYMVESAFNGATIYPLQVIRDSKARYDAGDDGQRCEHIGFNLSLQKPFYVNPQWVMHLSPNAPGGPSGSRARKTIRVIARSPVIGPLIFFINFFSTIFFIYSVMTLVMLIVYPFWRKMVTGASCQDENCCCLELNRRRNGADSSDFEFLLKTDISAVSSRKRKVSDFEFISN